MCAGYSQENIFNKAYDHRWFTIEDLLTNTIYRSVANFQFRTSRDKLPLTMTSKDVCTENEDVLWKELMGHLNDVL